MPSLPWPARGAATAAAAALLCATCLYLLAMALPPLFGARLIRVSASGMEPALRSGDLLITRDVTPSSIRPGDVVLYREPGLPAQLVAHRVAEVHNDGGVIALETAGDSLGERDPWRVDAADVLGRKSATLDGAGWIVDTLRSRRAALLFLLVPALALLGAELIARGRGGPRPAHDRDARRSAAVSYENRLRARLALPPADDATGRYAAPSWFVCLAALAALAAATAGQSALAAPERSSDGDARARLEARASTRAQELTQTATARAYVLDLRMSQYAAAPELRNADATADDIAAALDGLLQQPGNAFRSLTAVGADGNVIASTDSAITDVHSDAAFLLALAHGGVQVSDARPVAGADASIRYGALLLHPDGITWGVLVGRVDASVLSQDAAGSSGTWTFTIDSAGRTLTADAPARVQLPQLAYAPTAGVRAIIDSTPAACSISLIGVETNFDRGWRAVSCIPFAPAAATSSGSLPTPLAVLGIAFALLVVLAAAMRATPRPEPALIPRQPVGFEAIEAHLHRQRRESLR